MDKPPSEIPGNETKSVVADGSKLSVDQGSQLGEVESCIDAPVQEQEEKEVVEEVEPAPPSPQEEPAPAVEEPPQKPLWLRKKERRWKIFYGASIGFGIAVIASIGLGVYFGTHPDVVKTQAVSNGGDGDSEFLDLPALPALPAF